MSAVRLRPARSAAEWTEVLRAFPQRTRFHDWDFLVEEARVHGWRLRLLVAELDGRAVGAVPVRIGRGPLRRSPDGLHPYTGPLAAPEHLAGVLRALRRKRRRLGMARVSVSFPPDQPEGAAEALRAAGWSTLTDRTYAVDLAPHREAAQDPAVVLDCLHPKRRARLRRAWRTGVVVQRVGTVDGLLLEALRAAHDQHGRHDALPPTTVEWVAAALAAGDAIAVEGWHDGRRVGVLVGLRSGSTMLGWLGAALPEGRAVDAGTALTHEMLRLAAAEGMTRFDLLGHVDEGVAAFKRSMGAEPQPFVEGSDSAAVLAVARALVGGARSMAARSRASRVRGRAALHRTAAQSL